MGCKLLKIMANGLYDVFHRFGGWLLGLLGWRWRCPNFFLTRTQGFVNLVNTQQWLLDVHPMAAVLLHSLIFLLQPPKPAPVGLPAPSSRGWLCCRQAIPLTTHTSCYFLATSASPHSRPASRGSIHFLCVIRRHFRWVRADSGGNVFSQNTETLPVGPSYQVEESLFCT